MDAMQAMLTRRSVRHFTSQPVQPDELETLLRAAMSAPTSGNAQVWRFIVIDDRAVLDQIAALHPSGPVVREAPLAVLVCADEKAAKNPGRWPLDGAAATQNLLLAAHALGLGAVWLCVYPVADRAARLAALLGLPPGVEPVSLVPVGRPAEQPAPEDRYDPAKVHQNHW